MTRWKTRLKSAPGTHGFRELPSRHGLPLAHWSLAELGQEAMASGIVAGISGTTLWRWLGQDALRPLAPSQLDLPTRSAVRR